MVGNVMERSSVCPSQSKVCLSLSKPKRSIVVALSRYRIAVLTTYYFDEDDDIIAVFDLDYDKMEP